jgi:hypothetical protein
MGLLKGAKCQLCPVEVIIGSDLCEGHWLEFERASRQLQVVVESQTPASAFSVERSETQLGGYVAIEYVQDLVGASPKQWWPKRELLLLLERLKRDKLFGGSES